MQNNDLLTKASTKNFSFAQSLDHFNLEGAPRGFVLPLG